MSLTLLHDKLTVRFLMRLYKVLKLFLVLWLLVINFHKNWKEWKGKKGSKKRKKGSGNTLGIFRIFDNFLSGFFPKKKNRHFPVLPWKTLEVKYRNSLKPTLKIIITFKKLLKNWGFKKKKKILPLILKF